MRNLAVFDDLTNAQRDEAERALACYRLFTNREKFRLLCGWKANSFFGCRVSRALVAFIEG